MAQACRGSAPTASTPMRVLYVEDDRITGMLFVEALRREPCVTVRLAETPDDALALVQHWSPELLVLDAHLPGLSSHELLGRLRALPGLATVPAYMCSADSDADIRARADAAGFAGFWVKPVASQDLVCRMRALAAARAGPSAA